MSTPASANLAASSCGGSGRAAAGSHTKFASEAIAPQSAKALAMRSRAMTASSMRSLSSSLASNAASAPACAREFTEKGIATLLIANEIARAESITHTSPGEAVSLGEGAQAHDVVVFCDDLGANRLTFSAVVLKIGLVQTDYNIRGDLGYEGLKLVVTNGGTGRVIRVADKHPAGLIRNGRCETIHI